MASLPTGPIVEARAWLMAWWQRRSRARELGRQYAALQEVAPLVLADLHRFCLGGDQTFDPDHARLSDFNAGKRAVILHIATMSELDESDLQHLNEETARA